MSVVTAALIQLAINDDEPVDVRVARTVELTADAAADADLVVLPELWHIGAFALALAREHAQTLEGPIVTRMRAVAAEAGTWIHAGSIVEAASDGRYFNTSVVINADGEIAATYRKMHLFGFDAGERSVMSEGEGLVVVDTVVGYTGLATCYDLRFPELFRAMVARGAQSFLMPSGWPSARIGHWSLLARARAVENQAYVFACNEVGTHAGVRLGGRSVIIDPRGEVLAEAGTGEEVIAAAVDLDRVTEWRREFPVLADRRI